MSFQWATRAGVLRHLCLGNAVSRPTRVISAQNQLRRVCIATKPQLRARHVGFGSALFLHRSRTYASTAESAESKPKKKPTTKKPSGSKGAKSKSKQSKPGPKPKKKRVPSEKTLERQKLEKRRAKTRDLKASILQEPKKLLRTAWQLAFMEKYHQVPSNTTQRERFKAATELIKQMSPDEMAPLQAQAEENQALNKATYKTWVESYSPKEIRDANAARRMLTKITGKKYPTIKDDRRVRQPRSAYFLFARSRYASGDFKHISAAETAKRSSAEWQSMNATERQPFFEQHEREKERYEREYREVYGEIPSSYKRARKAQAAE